MLDNWRSLGASLETGKRQWGADLHVCRLAQTNGPASNLSKVPFTCLQNFSYRPSPPLQAHNRAKNKNKIMYTQIQFKNTLCQMTIAIRGVPTSHVSFGGSVYLTTLYAIYISAQCVPQRLLLSVSSEQR